MMSIRMFCNLAPPPLVLNISCYWLPIRETPMLSTDWAQLTINRSRVMIFKHMQPVRVSNLFYVRILGQTSSSSPTWVP